LKIHEAWGRKPVLLGKKKKKKNNELELTADQTVAQDEPNSRQWQIKALAARRHGRKKKREFNPKKPPTKSSFEKQKT